jgi:hypothetical protein
MRMMQFTRILEQNRLAHAVVCSSFSDARMNGSKLHGPSGERSLYSLRI